MLKLKKKKKVNCTFGQRGIKHGHNLPSAPHSNTNMDKVYETMFPGTEHQTMKDSGL